MSKPKRIYLRPRRPSDSALAGVVVATPSADLLRLRSDVPTSAAATRRSADDDVSTEARDYARESALADLDKPKDLANRKIKPPDVVKYAGIMKASAWNFPAQPIILDGNGVLLDGQHRLWAMVEANVTVRFVVQVWLKVRTPQQRIEALRIIDAGIGRKVSENLWIDGIENSQVVAPTARLAAALDAVPPEKRFDQAIATAEDRVTREAVYSFVGAHRAAIEDAAQWANGMRSIGPRVGLALGYLHCVTALGGDDPRMEELEGFRALAMSQAAGRPCKLTDKQRDLLAILRRCKGQRRSAETTDPRISVAAAVIQFTNGVGVVGMQKADMFPVVRR